MISRTDLRGPALASLDARGLRDALPRAAFDVEAALDAVRPICDEVHHRGADALRELSERFDGVRPTRLRVPAELLASALEQLDPDVRTALETSIERARAVHADQRRTDVTTTLADGGTVTERWVPVDRVGLYVPGGKAPLLSSVVMNVVPAQIAQVGSLAVASPPQKENQGELAGYPHPTILAACALLGLSYGALQNLTLVLALASVPRSRTHTASAVWNIGFDAGTALGSVLVGMIAAGVGFPTAMLVAGLLSLPTLPLALRARSVGSPAR